jgi:hypothetical protein
MMQSFVVVLNEQDSGSPRSTGSMVMVLLPAACSEIRYSRRGRRPYDCSELVCYECGTRNTPQWRTGPEYVVKLVLILRNTASGVCTLCVMLADFELVHVRPGSLSKRGRQRLGTKNYL